MNLLHATVIALTLLGAALCRDASAQSVADTVERWGLLGTWSVDCRQPPRRGNTHFTFEQRGVRVEARRDFGDPAANDVSNVLAARLLRDGGLEISQGPKDPYVNAPAKGGDGRIRSMSGRLANGQYTVRDGTVVGSGAPTPWLSRCR